MRKSAAFVAWLVATIFFGGVGGAIMLPQLMELYDLSKLNKLAQGEIVDVYPNIHDTCKVQFSYNDVVYVNTERSCGHRSVGEQTAIYFSPLNPNMSQNTDPWSVFINDLIPSILALTTFPLLAALITYIRFADTAQTSRPSARCFWLK